MITVQQFLPLDKPVADPLAWANGQNFGLIDNVTGDKLLFCYQSTDTNIVLFVCAQNSQVWVKKATVNVGSPNGILGVCQDVTNGAVHALLFDNAGLTNARTYARWALTRSGGHVTGFTVTTSFTLTTHVNNDLDPQGNIYIFKFGGIERLAYIYGYATTAGPTTDLVQYAAESSTLTPSSSASFIGIDGSGSDTLVVNLTDATGIRTNHTFSAWLAQETSTENLYLIVGHRYSGDTLNVVTTGTLNDCWYKQLAKGASGWTAPTATTAGTAFATDDGTIVPNVMAVYTGTSRAYVMYMSPTGGVKYSYLDSAGALNTITASPLSTTHRGGHGTFSVDANNNIHTVFITEGVSGSVSPVNRYSYYDATQAAWTININGTATTDTIAIVGFGVQTKACFAAQIEGNTVSQTVTKIVKVAGIFDANPFPVAPLKRPPPGRKPGKQPAPNKFRFDTSSPSTNIPAALNGISVVSTTANASILGSIAASGLFSVSTTAFGSALGSNAASGLLAISTIDYASLLGANNATGQSIVSTALNGSILGSGALTGQSVTSDTLYGPATDASVTGALNGIAISSITANGSLLASVSLSALTISSVAASGSLQGINNASGISLTSLTAYGDLEPLSAGSMSGLTSATTVTYGDISFTIGVAPVVTGSGGGGGVVGKKRKQVMREGQVFGEEYPVSPDIGQQVAKPIEPPSQLKIAPQKSNDADYEHAIAHLMRHLL